MVPPTFSRVLRRLGTIWHWLRRRAGFPRNSLPLPPISAEDVARAQMDLEDVTPEERAKALEAARRAVERADRDVPEPPVAP